MSPGAVLTVLVWLTLTAPFAGALLVLGPGRRSCRSAGRIALAAALLAAAASAAIAAAALAGASLLLELPQFAPPLRLALQVQPMGALFALTVSLLSLMATLHALDWLREDRRYRAFHAVMLCCLGLMLLVSYSANLLTLLVGYELLSLAAFGLIVHQRSPAAMRAGIKYLAYILPAAALTLIGTLLLFDAAGSLDFVPGGVAAEVPAARLHLAAICLVIGFGVKAALFPLHGWVPDAHPAAPAPFSAVLSGVMVATGAFAILRVMFELIGVVALARTGLTQWLGLLAGCGVLVGGVLAVAEDDLKRRLAYSTISQMSYVLLAASLLDQQALVGALVHLANHAFIKGGLFFCAGALILGAGVHRVSELGGIARRMPLTAVVLTVLSLALIGVPPLSGFVGKWLMGGSMAAAGSLAPLAVLLLGSLLAALYLWPVVAAVWSGKDSAFVRSRQPVPGDPPRMTRLALLAAALASLVFGLAAGSAGYPLSLAELAAESAFTGGAP